MPQRDEQRRLAYKRIDQHMPNIADLMDFVNVGISMNSSFIHMAEGAKKFYEALEMDVASIKEQGSEPQSASVSISKLPRANNEVSELAGELLKAIRSYVENVAILKRTDPENVLPDDYDVIYKFRNYAEHSGGGTHVPMCYIFSEKTSETVWDLGLDLAAILRDVGRLSRRRGKHHLDALIGLPQNKGGILNLSEHIDVAVHFAMENHVGDSNDIEIELTKLTADLRRALATAKDEENVALLDILELYEEREALRVSLAEDAKKLAESFPEIQIFTEES